MHIISRFQIHSSGQVQMHPCLPVMRTPPRFITMRNIQTLTDYVKNRFGSNTRIILSEQGFSSTYGGQANQAAAIALAYYKAACNPMIDAFIIRSYKDEAHEVAQGLAMGLKDAKWGKKEKQRIMSFKKYG